MRREDWMMIGALSILWGGSFIFTEIALTALPPLLLVWLRVLLATAALALALPVLGIAYPPRKTWPSLMAMAVLNNILPFTLIATAQGQITGALASVLNATTPLFTLVVAHFATTDERITLPKALGLGLGFTGVVVMLAGGEMGGALLAKLCSLLAALSYGCAGVFGRRFRQMKLAPLSTAFGQVAASSLILMPAALWLSPESAFIWPGLRVAGAILGLGILSTALAYALFFQILARTGATSVSIVTFLIPVSATAMGALFLNERLQAQSFAGFALICLGLLAIDGRLRPWIKV